MAINKDNIGIIEDYFKINIDTIIDDLPKMRYTA